MDRLVDEAEALGGAVHPSAITSNSRPEPIPDQQLSILNSITANDLTGKSKSAGKTTGNGDVCLSICPSYLTGFLLYGKNLHFVLLFQH